MIATYIKEFVYKTAQINMDLISNQRCNCSKSITKCILIYNNTSALNNNNIIQSCPKLQVMFKGSKKEVKGAEAIYDYLTQLNRQIRQVLIIDSYVTSYTT